VNKIELKQIIKEEIISSNLTSKIKDAIDSVDENLSYKILAQAIAQILIKDYGSHNFEPFVKVLQNELKINT
jgi:hypothetical protein